jgi:hypothetical protein
VIREEADAMDAAGLPQTYQLLVAHLRDELPALLPQVRPDQDALGFALRRGTLSARIDPLDHARAVVSWLYQGRLALRTLVPLDGRTDDIVADLTGFFCGVPLAALRLGKPYLPLRDRAGRERVARSDRTPMRRQLVIAPMSFAEFSRSVDARAREVIGPIAGRGLIVEPDLKATLWLSGGGVARVWTSGNDEAVGKLTTRAGLPLRQLASTRLDEIGVETAAQFVARVAAPDISGRLWR